VIDSPPSSLSSLSLPSPIDSSSSSSCSSSSSVSSSSKSDEARYHDSCPHSQKLIKDLRQFDPRNIKRTDNFSSARAGPSRQPRLVMGNGGRSNESQTFGQRLSSASSRQSGKAKAVHDESVLSTRRHADGGMEMSPYPRQTSQSSDSLASSHQSTRPAHPPPDLYSPKMPDGEEGQSGEMEGGARRRTRSGGGERGDGCDCSMRRACRARTDPPLC
jgi:hypothetical protein